MSCADAGWAYVGCADAGWAYVGWANAGCAYAGRTDEGCLPPERNEFTKPLIAQKEPCPSQHSQSHSDYVTRIINSDVRERRASQESSH